MILLRSALIRHYRKMWGHFNPEGNNRNNLGSENYFLKLETIIGN